MTIQKKWHFHAYISFLFLVSLSYIKPTLQSYFVLAILVLEIFNNLVIYGLILYFIVDALQYLSLTRLDVAFAVNHVCQCMERRTHTYWVAMKCILRYLKHAINHGLFLYGLPLFNQRPYPKLGATKILTIHHASMSKFTAVHSKMAFTLDSVCISTFVAILLKACTGQPLPYQILDT